MSTVPPELKYIKGFTVTGLSTRTQNSNEFSKETAKIPNLWHRFYSRDLVANENIYGVYSDYESDANGLYTVTAGVTSEHAPTDTEMGSVSIPEGNYLVFQGKGAMPLAVIQTWGQVWEYFAAENQYQRSFSCDFEAYKGSEEVAIYIGIK